MMMGLPAARAGPTLWVTRLKGKLKGEMPKTGPRGKRRVIPHRPRLGGVKSSGMTSPPILAASWAARLRVSTPRAISPRA